MLTFAEFFTKKKIDIQKLKHVKPELYQEFERDYEQMGEKSFDHSKKFWFNRLRHQFLLETIEVPKVKPEVSRTAGSPSSGKAASKPTGFRPKFKAGTAQTASGKEDRESAIDPVEMSQEKKATFKPRFRPGVTRSSALDDTKKEANPNDPTPKEEVTASVSKPSGFKPRFKPNTASKAEEDETGADAPSRDPDTPESAETSNKSSKPSGFTPRFKAKSSTNDEQASASGGQQNPEEEQPSRSKPTGFKPRFKAGVTRSTTSQTEAASSHQETPKEDQTPQPASDDNRAGRSAGFTPRVIRKQSATGSGDQEKPEDVAAKEQSLDHQTQVEKESAARRPSSASQPETDPQITERSEGSAENKDLKEPEQPEQKKKTSGFKPRILQERQKNTPNKDSSDNS